MKFILGTKEYMTQMFTEDGKARPVTVISAGPVVVTQVKTKERDGYTGVQIGYGTKKKTTKARAGHFKKAGVDEPFRYVREIRTDEVLQVGEKFDTTVFEVGEKVIVSGISKGKGFQGVVKRHGFHGGPRTHGQKHSEREAGSIGATGPQRVLKGTRMAGRMGTDRVTVKNLVIEHIDPKEGILYVRGAIPGRKGTVLEIVGK